MVTRVLRRVSSVVALGLALTSGSAIAQTPTYQGVLQNAGAPAEGTFDVRLSLFAAASGGSALQVVTQAGVTVDRGVFTVPLNFDPVLFSATSQRYLGVEVRPAGTTTFTTLTPRQPIGAAPVALSMPGLVRVPSVTPDQNIAPDATSTAALSGLVWQSFTSTVSGTLRAVTLKLNNELTSSARNITATLIQGEGTSGAVLSSVIVSVLGSQGDPRSVTLDFPVGVAVAVGETFTVRLSNDTFVNWYISDTDAYAGGRSNLSASRDFALASFIELASSPPSINIPGGLSTSSLSASGDLSADGEAMIGGGASIGGSTSIGGDVTMAGNLGVAPYQGGTAGSAVQNSAKQVVLGGAYNTGANGDNAVKLLIADYDNDAGSNIYPIYIEDENNVVDFFVRKQGNANLGVTTGFLNGNLGLGTSTPAARLSISGGSVSTTGYQILISNSGVANSAFSTTGLRVTNDGFFEITNNANLGAGAVLARLSGTGNWTSTSDRRMKSDIRSESPANLLDAALRLRPVTYYFNAEKDQKRLPKHPHLGLIAQEVRDVLPGLVESGSEMLTLDYSGLGIVTIGAVQEQQKQIEELRAENAALRARLDHIEQIVKHQPAKD